MRISSIIVLLCVFFLSSFALAQDELHALLVVDDEGALNEGDLAVLDRLELTFGIIVDVVNHEAVDSTWAEGMDLVYISSTVSSGTLGAKLKNVTVPTIVIEPYSQDDMGMTLDVDSMRYYQSFQRDLEIVAEDHYLAAGLAGEVYAFDEYELQSGQGIPNENGVLIANYVYETGDDPDMNYGAIYCYEKGAIMADTTAAPERRVFAGWNDLGVAHLTEEGLKLWDASINWCLYKDEDTIVEHAPKQPRKHALLQNYPNPFNPETTISFSLEKTGPVKLTVYDLQGKVVTRLVDDNLSAGEHRIRFTASEIPSGVYLYSLKTADFTISKKMTLLR